MKQKNRSERGSTPPRVSDQGGTFTGLLIGFVVGLALALVLAVYVTKVPVPFLNKTQTRSADQDAVEAKKNKDWDPNSGLYGKRPAKGAEGAPSPDEASPEAKVVPAALPAAPPATATAPALQPPSTSTASPAPAPSAKASPKADANGSDPLADLIKSKTADRVADPFNYFVQVGAFNKPEDAEREKAQLALAGMEAQLSPREQGGSTVYRVRLGPFERRDQAEAVRKSLEEKNTNSILVKTQR